jgi:Glycosyltransferase sugar-binding region containing DXD motif
MSTLAAATAVSVVPAHVHFLWTGPGFGLCHRLAVESVLLTNPQLSVTLHLVEEAPRREPNRELEQLHDRPRLTLRERTPRDVLAACDDAATLLATYQRIPAKAASAKSNLLRYAILWREGGIYLDLDVLVVRSLEPLRAAECSLGTELVWRADEARVAGELAPWMAAPSAAFAAAIALRRTELALGTSRLPILRGTHAWHRWLEQRWSRAQPNNAVLAAAPRARFLAALLERAPTVDATVRFRLGPTLVTEIARRHPTAATLLPPDVLYFVPPSQSFRFFREAALQLPPRALLIHYVSSNHRRELELIARDGLAAIPPSLFRKLASAVAAGRAPLS